jgi:hypothetical protein
VWLDVHVVIPLISFCDNSVQGKALGQVLPKKGSFLKNLDLFDHVEFGVTGKDAQHMAVGTRKLIELVRHFKPTSPAHTDDPSQTFLALSDSGIEYRGHNIGAYMAAVSHDQYMVGGLTGSHARLRAHKPSIFVGERNR